MTNDFFLILPNIRSTHNVGAMFRSADACGVTKLFLTGYTPLPPRKEIAKVSLGAETWLPWEHHATTLPLIKRLKKSGVTIIGLEQTTQSVDIGTFVVEGSIALVVGNEVTGISRPILKECNTVTHIPMYGRKESLNVSVAAGIALYEIKKIMVREYKK